MYVKQKHFFYDSKKPVTCKCEIVCSICYFSFGYTVRPWDACFLGKGKTRAAQNSCNFCYLIGEGKMIKKPCCSRFSLHINSFSSNFFWTQFKNVHLLVAYSLRPCILRPYCTYVLDSYKYNWILCSLPELMSELGPDQMIVMMKDQLQDLQAVQGCAKRILEAALPYLAQP